MSRSKHDMLDEMIGHIGLMSRLMNECNIKDDRLSFFAAHSIDILEKLPADFIREGYKWLNSIYEDVGKPAKRALDLLPQDLWEKYKTWGWDLLENSRESIIIRKALKAFRARVCTRKGKPDFFKKGKFNAQIKKYLPTKTPEACCEKEQEAAE